MHIGALALLFDDPRKVGAGDLASAHERQVCSSLLAVDLRHIMRLAQRNQG